MDGNVVNRDLFGFLRRPLFIPVLPKYNPANHGTLSATVPGVPRLRRTLTLWDLIFYGIVLIQPIAPVPLYGVAQKLSDGHFVTIILIALPVLQD